MERNGEQAFVVLPARTKAHSSLFLEDDDHLPELM